MEVCSPTENGGIFAGENGGMFTGRNGGPRSPPEMDVAVHLPQVVGQWRSPFVAVRLPQVVGQWLGFLCLPFAVCGSPLAVRSSPFSILRSSFAGFGGRLLAGFGEKLGHSHDFGGWILGVDFGVFG
ncbi:hypothetical protein Salat_0212400 [Sesamum alatum]|uniref:Uncharacterized protein n=1 Tax=Sesamum alatum TaxID=300844 RepID=A0AAE1YZR3_9LAMI|nr:hypothetical protein Salat_0212400 [Sesamum alatum]